MRVSFGTIVLPLHCYYEYKKWNVGFSQITSFKESKNVVVEKPQVNDKDL